MTDDPSVTPEDGTMTFTLPVAPNRWIVLLGLGVGVPWLLVFLGGGLVAPFLVSAADRREVILGAIAVNLLFAIAHILAIMGVWLAAYKLRGSERIELTPDAFTVRRSALGISVPFRLRRTAGDEVRLLDPSQSPGKAAHARLEVRSGRAAVRFGAGLSAAQASELCNVLTEQLNGVR